MIEEEIPGEEQVTPPELNFASAHFDPASTLSRGQRTKQLR
jgi:hypothetical protein